ncbi:uncharacterized protein AB675_2230, partial [Cyphellophora attinorum]
PPRPPILPQSIEEFTESVNADPSAWYNYCSAIYDHVSQLTLRNEALELENKENNTALNIANGIKEYQKEEMTTLNLRLLDVMKERDQAVTLAIPAVHTPESTPTPGPRAEA